MDTQDEIGYSKQIMYNTVGTMVTLFCQWLIIMIIPKITDFSEAGIFAVAISICSILNPIATFSLREYQIADQNLRFTDADYRAVRIITITLSLVAVIPFVVIFGYGLVEIATILGYLVYRNLLHYAYLYSASLQIHSRLDLVGIHSIVEGILSFVSFVLVYVLTKDLVVATFLMALIGGGAFLVLQFISCRKCVGVKEESYDKSRAKQLLLIGLPLCFSVLALALMNSMPKLFLQADCGDALAGIFSTLSAPT
ncbi:MAG: hypothetical protein II848_00555, partial [Candidatus Methanomethylophilus sp.]|nr:hypothetical protein [Methanomethylophilus sp.]